MMSRSQRPKSSVNMAPQRNHQRARSMRAGPPFTAESPPWILKAKTGRFVRLKKYRCPIHTTPAAMCRVRTRASREAVSKAMVGPTPFSYLNAHKLARARPQEGRGADLEVSRTHVASSSARAPFGCRPFSGLGEDGLQGSRPYGAHLVVEDGVGGFDA